MEEIKLTKEDIEKRKRLLKVAERRNNTVWAEDLRQQIERGWIPSEMNVRGLPF